MKVYAFVGVSGSGKSHHSQNVAYENGIDYIIDDALLIKGTKVVATVEKQGRSPKIIVFKMKPKKNYRKKQGHRQAYTKVLIKEIVLD